MRRPIASIAIFGVLSFTSCRKTQMPVGPARPLESPDYAVYDAVLDGLFGSSTSANQLERYVVEDSTMVGTSVEAPSVAGYLRRELGVQLEPLLDAVRSDYITRSSVRVALAAEAFHVHPRVELMSRHALDSLIVPGPRNPGTYWSAFYARYPHSNGSISFSRPGYDASRTHAFLSYGHVCGGLCGDWGFVLLERRGDRWVVLRRVITSVA